MIMPPRKNVRNSRLTTAKQILHEEGFLIFLKHVILFLASYLFLYECRYIYEKRLDRPEELSMIPCKVDNLILRVITCPEEFEGLLSDGFDPSPYEMDIQQCKETLSRGAIFFCAFIDKEFAHGSWISMDKRTHNEFYHFSIDHGDTASVGATYTSPKYRGRGIYTYVYSRIFQYLREKGRAKVVFEVHKDNIVVHRAQDKLGSNLLCKVYSLRLLSRFNSTWVKSISKVLTL